MLSHVKAGNYTYGVINLPYAQGRLMIGHFCSISDNVSFLTSGEHYKDHISTYPFYAHVLGKAEPGGTTKGDIVIGDDVWIGYGATILSGVTIGQGAIIGAGSVVAKNIPPYAVFAGNKIVKYRFSEEMIEKLLKFDYGSLSEKDIKDNIDLLYSPITDSFFDSSLYIKHQKN